MRKFVLCLGFVLPALAQADGVPFPLDESDFNSVDPALVELGEQLFFDPVLSVNDDLACANCHHPNLVEERFVPLWNLGAREVTGFGDAEGIQTEAGAMFGIRMPDGHALERPVADTLTARVMWELLAPGRLRGMPDADPVTKSVADGWVHGPDGGWDRVTREVTAIAAYRDALHHIFGDDTPAHATQIATALGAYIATLRATDSPFDRLLNGDPLALGPEQLRGMGLFYGEAGCSTCHSGKFMTDRRLHAQTWLLAKVAGAQVTVTPIAARDAAAPPHPLARTPSLRNVTLKPRGDDDGIASLEAKLRQHADPALEDVDLRALRAFLDALGDPAALAGGNIPVSAPSGLVLLRPD